MSAPLYHSQVVVIGASMVDVMAQASSVIRQNDSTPGQVFVSAGGVSRNISENLARLGVGVDLISVLCADPLGDLIRSNTQAAGVNLEASYIDHQHSSTTYSALLNPDGTLHVALSDTSSLDAFPLKHVQQQAQRIEHAQAIVLDAALPDDILAFLFKHYAHKAMFVDPVSVAKAHSLPPHLARIHTLKCNALEAEFLSGIPVKDENDVVRAAAQLKVFGIQQVFITLGERGVYVHTPTHQNFVRVEPIQARNVTGAGDAFMAGLVYAFVHQLDFEKTLKIATQCAKSALMSVSAVNPKLSMATIESL